MGEGVNIATRLEGIAEPGTVLLSEDAYRQVKTRLDLIVQDLGEVQLKNIAERVRVYSLRVAEKADKVPSRLRFNHPRLITSVGLTAAAAGAAILLFSDRVPRLASSRADPPLACKSTQQYSDQSKAANIQLLSTPMGDKSRQCDLKARFYCQAKPYIKFFKTTRKSAACEMRLSTGSRPRMIRS
jgi:hypothetical protein